MSKMFVLIAIAIAAVMLLAGCGSDEPDTPGLLQGLAQAAQQAEQMQQQQQQQAEAAAQAQAEAMRRQIEAEVKGLPAPQPAVPPGGAQPAAPAAPGMIGVPACDEYLTKYPACLESKVPAMAKTQMMAGFEATKAGWMQMAATPQGKAALEPACQMALSQAKMAMAVYGCQF
jgi:hypothetical protein